MRKLISVIALIICVVTTNAQQLLSKHGTPIIPEAKDWGLGFDATPLLKYAGNFFNHADNNNVLMDYVHGLNIVGLYVKDSATAYRVRLGINYNSAKEDLVAESALASGAKIVNAKTTTTNNITFGAGLQKMRGKGRLHGIYGADIFFTVKSGNRTIVSPVDNDTLNVTGTVTYSYAEALGSNNPNGGNARINKIEAGGIVEFGLRGFIGAEYFFAPKISLSAQYGWGFGLAVQSEGIVTSEDWNTQSVESQQKKYGKISSFGLNNDNSGGIITLTCYF
jgi:hypothetical protein